MAYLKRSKATISEQTSLSPILTTPALGTPASGVMTNMTGLVGGGKVIQAVTHSGGTPATSSDDTWLTAVTGNITMASTSNKLLMIGQGRGEVSGTGDLAYGGLKMVTSGTGVSAATIDFGSSDSVGNYSIVGNDGTSDPRFGFSYTVEQITSPAVAGAVTVTLYGRRYSGGSTMHLNRFGTTRNSYSTLLLLELSY